MADAAPVVHIGENSPEEVAYKLMRLIMDVENRQPYGHGDAPVDREWVLRTYAQCIGVTRQPHNATSIVGQFAPPIGERRR